MREELRIATGFAFDLERGRVIAPVCFEHAKVNPQ
jgi:hypothetical protein